MPGFRSIRQTSATPLSRLIHRALYGAPLAFALGVTVLHEDRYARVERTAGKPPRVACQTRAGRRLDSDVLLYCVGRDGNTNDIGLGTLGIKPGKYGLLEVNENYQTVHPHVYAVGDVIGYPALASTSSAGLYRPEALSSSRVQSGASVSTNTGTRTPAVASPEE